MNLSWLVLVVCCLSCVSADRDDDELEVVIAFVEYDIEDGCVKKNEATWAFRNGSQSDLHQLVEVEKANAAIMRGEIKQITDQGHDTKEHSSHKLNRLLDLLFHSGAQQLSPQEHNEALEYAVKLEEINVEAILTMPDGHNLTRRGVDEKLRNEKEEMKMKEVWEGWFKLLEEESDLDWLHQLTLLDLEAEVNGEEELAAYWLKQSEVTWVDYGKVEQLWKSLIPLYQKLRQFIASHIVKQHGKESIINLKLIPTHILGSLDSTDWIATAEKHGALDESVSYQFLKAQLSNKTHKDIYVMADNFTQQLKLGALPTNFYKQSRFSVGGDACVSYMTQYCKSEYQSRVMSCDEDRVTVQEFVDAQSNVMRATHLLQAGLEDSGNGYLTREGPRDSVLYEAMAALAATLSLNPDHFRQRGLLPANVTDDDITLLLLSALHTIPPMPYYLAADKWRINALNDLDTLTTTETDSEVTEESSPSEEMERRRRDTEIDEEEEEETSVTEDQDQDNNTTAETQAPVVTSPSLPRVYNEDNLTRSWWELRETLQGVTPPAREYVKDFIRDGHVIWNRAYLSKFLGSILQFQILERLREVNLTKNNTNITLLQAMLRRGTSVPWEQTVASLLNITELSTEPLLRYFKPLEEFLDSGAFQTKRTPLFTNNDLKLFGQSSSLNTGDKQDTAPAEGSEAVLYTLAAVALLGTAAMALTIARRRYKRNKRAARTRAQNIEID